MTLPGAGVRNTKTAQNLHADFVLFLLIAVTSGEVTLLF